MIVTVHGEEGGSGGGGAAGCPLDGVLDIKQLEIEKHLLALAGELAGKIETATHDELEPDLIEADRLTELLHQLPSFLEARTIEGDNQPVTCRDAPHTCLRVILCLALPPSHRARARVDALHLEPEGARKTSRGRPRGPRWPNRATSEALARFVFC